MQVCVSGACSRQSCVSVCVADMCTSVCIYVIASSKHATRVDLRLVYYTILRYVALRMSGVRSSCLTSTSKHTHTLIYIYLYIYVCVCVCYVGILRA